MSLSQRLRHRFTAERAMRRAFPSPTFERVEQAIAHTERLHRGQICFAMGASLDGDASW
ncbi:MAG: hypothetical protein ACK53A_06395 [Gemmatimonadota bacterium]|jgi:hypothetical protein